MKILTVLLSVILVAMIMNSCSGRNCATTHGNRIDLRGQDFDSLYNSVTILPAQITGQGKPNFFAGPWWSLPIDIAHSETSYILRGNNRTDTITLQYDVLVDIFDDDCGYEARTTNMQISTTYSNVDFILKFDKQNIWELWVDL